MKVLINNVTYKIIEVDTNSDKLVLNNVKYYGVHCAIGEIYIDKSLPLAVKKRALIHELTHAFAYQHAFNYHATNEKTISEEEMCEFIASFGEKILEIADKYIRRKTNV